MLLITDLLII